MKQDESTTESRSQEEREPFYPGRRLPYCCPRCDAGGLLLVGKTLKYVSTPWTRDGDEDGYLDPWDGETRFSCLFQCSNPRCEEIVLCGGRHYLTEDWATGYQKYVPVCHPMMMLPLDAGHELPSAGASDNSTAVTMPFALDPTDENILMLLAKASQRLLSSAIMSKLDQRGVGKNLSKLGKAGLIDNKPRKGYRLTERGKPIATKLVEDRES